MNAPQREAGRWWRQALSDFEALSPLIQAGKYDVCCFLAQQVAEKALKAFLYRQGEELVFGHAVFRLCTQAAEVDPAFETLRDEVKTLDFYYVEARYPNALQEAIPAEFYSRQDADQAVWMARRTLEVVGERLGPEALEELRRLSD